MVVIKFIYIEPKFVFRFTFIPMPTVVRIIILNFIINLNCFAALCFYDSIQSVVGVWFLWVLNYLGDF